MEPIAPYRPGLPEPEHPRPEEPLISERGKKSSVGGFLRRRGKAVVALVAVVSFTVGAFLAIRQTVQENAGTGTPEDPGEVSVVDGPSGFCPRAGWGQPDEVLYYTALSAAAPEGIAETVEDLLREARNLEDLRQDGSIEDMFRAAFDPERRSSERKLRGFVSEECGAVSACHGSDRQHYC